MKTKTPTIKEIIEIMKNASDALSRFNEAHEHLDISEKEETELELWSSNLRCDASTLHVRIIYK